MPKFETEAPCSTGTTMSVGLTMLSLSLAADSIVIGSVAMRRISICKEAFERFMELISELIRLNSRVAAFSSSLDRRITVEHIPTVAVSIIAKRIHEGINRNPLRVAGINSRESSRGASVGTDCPATCAFVCLLVSQYVFPALFKEYLLCVVTSYYPVNRSSEIPNHAIWKLQWRFELLQRRYLGGRAARRTVSKASFILVKVG